jgi:hypothetical protein
MSLMLVAPSAIADASTVPRSSGDGVPFLRAALSPGLFSFP